MGLGVVRDLVGGLNGRIACERRDGRTVILVSVPADASVEIA
jgi:nitrogen-specific signal transduction histidine kinase